MLNKNGELFDESSREINSEKSFRKMSRIMGHGFLGIGIILLILIIWV